MSGISLLDAISNLITLHHLSQYQATRIKEYFSHIKIGEYVYAGIIQSRLNISIDDAYFILEELKKQGFLVHWYEVYCHNCNRSTGVFLDTPRKFNPDQCCSYCDSQMSIGENLIVLYKVVKL